MNKKLKIKQVVLKNILSMIAKTININTKDDFRYGIGKFFRMKSEKGHWQIFATDTAKDLILDVPDKFDNDFDMCLPISQMRDMVNLLKDDVLEFRVTPKGWLVLKSVGAKYRFPMRKSEDFPDINRDLNHSISLSTKSFLQALKNQSMAIGKQDSGNFILKSVCFKIENDHLKISTTDGTKIARTLIPLSESIPNSKDLIITKEALTSIQRLLTKKDEDIKLEFSDNAFRIRCPRKSLTVRLNVASFPNIDKLIHNDFQTSFTIQNDLLSDALKRALLFSPSLCIDCVLKKDTLTLETRDVNLGDAREEIPIKSIDFDKEEIVFGVFAHQFISVLDYYEGLFEVSIPEDMGMPIKFMPLDIDYDFVYLIIPTRPKKLIRDDLEEELI